ncbi:MAG: glycosyltransferase family 4 protein [Cyanobacteria bacterium SZAS-4]|nr:glycosyltransferase family 4 protein [Cyanobacteria bacterium SZAS-4]
MRSEKIKLALISCGLGNVNRGFEVSTARLFKTLKQRSDFDVRLYSGGKHDGATVTWNIPRDEVIRAMSLLAHFNDRRSWEFAYGVEQISFALSLLPELFSFQPDVIWIKEVPFGYFLDAYRKMFGFKYKIIFANGGAFNPQTYKDFDYIQHLQPESHDDAIRYGLPSDKNLTLTNFLYFEKSQKTRQELRAQFGYSESDWIVICVAAWNRYHKRIDYLIDEVAQLPDKNVKLMLCGHPEPDIAYLRKLADEKLPGRVQWLTLTEAKVHEALQAADVFVLPSTNEGLGNAMAEAAMAELPVVAHSHAASRFVLGDEKLTTDLLPPGALAAKLASIKENPPSKEDLKKLSSAVHNLFSAEALLPRFCDMVQTVKGTTPPANGQHRLGKYDLRAEN